MAWINLTYARPGGGKSLDAVRTSLDLLASYGRTEKKYPKLKKRVLWSNLKFSEKVEKKFGEKIQYWESPRQLYDLRHVDIIWDEIARHLPADNWVNTPDDMRAMFAQHRKRGLRFYCNTQDYSAVDKNFRRMVRHAYLVTKVIGSRDISVSLPPVKHIWGIIVKREFNPDEIEVQQNIEYLKTLSTNYFFITRRLISAYDTTQEIPKFSTSGLEHIERQCDDCGKSTIIHKPN